MVVWSAADYDKGSFLSWRGRLPLACSRKQLMAGWPLISFFPFSGFSSGSSCPQPVSALPVPLHPHATRRARLGRDNPHKPEAGAVKGIPRGGTDNCILSVASGRGKGEAATGAGRLQGRCWSRGQVHGASRAGEGSGGALPSWGGAWRLRLGGCPPPSPLPSVNSLGLP